LVWSTVVSSVYTDEALSVVVDASGIYATGNTGDSASFGVPTGVPNHTYGTPSPGSGEDDMWAAKINPTTGELQWTTILGSTESGDDIGESISYGTNVNGIPGVYVVGTTNRDGFAGGPTSQYGDTGTYMAAAQLNPSDGTLVWSAVIGSSFPEQFQEAHGSDFKNGHLYIAGTTSSGLGLANGPQFTVGSNGGDDVAMGDMYPLGFWTINSQSGYKFTLPNGTDVSSNGQTGDLTIYVNNTTANKIVGILDVNFTASQGDIILPNITSGSDVSAGIALFHNGSAYPDTVLSKWLLVPNTTGNPYHCPSVTSMADISTACTGVDLSPSYTTVTIGGQVYFKMQNQGGGNQGGEEVAVPELSDYAMYAILGLVGVAAIGFNRKRL